METDRLAEEIAGRSGSSPIETILRRAAQTLGVLTQELGVALGPRLDQSMLRRLELVRVSSERLLMVLTLEGGVMRTVFVEVPGEIADIAHHRRDERCSTSASPASRWRRFATSLPVRLRDAAIDPSATELLNIFLQEGEQMFDAAMPIAEGQVVLGAASVLAEQPEFLRRRSSCGGCSRSLKRPRRLARRFASALHAPGISITIGAEHDDPRLDDFTVVTAEYHVGSLAGVIGVIGPTRMPYDKVISLVSHTSRLLSDLLD